MNRSVRGALASALAVLLLAASPLLAAAAPRAHSSPEANAPALSAAAVPASPLPPSPTIGDLGDMLGYYRAWSVHLDAGTQFAVRLTTDEPDIHAGLLPPSATSLDDEFVSSDDGGTSYVSYLRYVAPTTGDYTLLIYCGASFPDTAIGTFEVAWQASPASAVHNIPGVTLPAEGTAGELSPFAGWAAVYRVSVDEGHGLHVRLSSDSSEGDVDLDIWNTGWTDLYRRVDPGDPAMAAWSSAPAGFVEQAYFRASASGDYYPTAWLWRGPERTPYDIDYKITEPTTVTAVPSTLKTSYGKTMTISSALTQDDLPLNGHYVRLEKYAKGWTYLADGETGTELTSAGEAVFVLRPTTNLRIRTWYPGVFWQRTPAFSAVRDISVGAYLPTPSTPSIVTHARTFTITGYVKPRHATGTTCPIVLKFERRLSNGTYSLYKTVRTRGYNYSSYTKYTAATSLPYAGTWRVRAYHPGDAITATNGNGPTYSSYRSISVR